MARALIRINGTDSTFTAVAIGSTVSLTNHDEGGEVSYFWAIVDQPEGTADNLSATGVENVTFTPTKEGSYELKLAVNAALSTVAVQTAIVAVLDARTGERVPAATETTETSVSAGWAMALKRILARTLHATADTNLIVAQTPGGVSAGGLVTLSGTATINSGTQAAFTVTRLAAALGTTFHRDRIGVVIDGVSPGTLSANALVLVRIFGLVPLSATGSPSVGDPVYLSNIGTPSLTPGTAQRMIGTVVAATGGTYQWVIDSDRRHSGLFLGKQVLTGSGTYVPTPGTTRVYYEMVGAGGGGGGAGATNPAIAAGGNSGVYIAGWFGTVGTFLLGGAHACGASAAGGANTGGTGATGADTTFVPTTGTTITAKGGSGGTGTAGSAGPLIALTGALSASGSTSSDKMEQGLGQHGWSDGSRFYSGAGGSTPMGTGGDRSTNIAINGNNAIGPGGGGAGAIAQSTGRAGGSSGAGQINVWEFS